MNKKIISVICILSLSIILIIIIFNNIKEESGILLQKQTLGGLCPDGICTSRLDIMKDGSYKYVSYSRRDEGRFTREQINKLKDIIEKTDFSLIRQKSFTGLCPTAYDGQEAIYIFYTINGEEKISSCESEMNYNSELFIEISKLEKDLS